MIEERSRFEENANRVGLDLQRTGTGYSFADVQSRWEGWQARAALEDRQEAAHNAVGEIQCRYCLRMVSVYRVDTDERKLCEFCWKSAHPEESFRPGVPSEATPTKENAPTANCGLCGKEMKPSGQIVHGHAIYFCCNRAFAAPAPEVQGTPRSLGKLIHDATVQNDEEFVVTSEEFEIMCAATPGPQAVGASLFCGKKLRIESPAPVGTPQKETPSSISAESSSPLQLAEEKTVPEGVQGKEPQTFDEWRKEFANQYPNYPIGPSITKAAYLAGEAAGRRSAITEMKEWAEVGYSKEDEFRVEAVYCAVIEKCDELLEKTK